MRPILIVLIASTFPTLVSAGLPGTYVLDRDSLDSSITKYVEKKCAKLQARGKPAHPNKIKGSLVHQMADLKFEIQFKEDGSVVYLRHMPDGELRVKGTWRLEGQKLTMRQTHHDGIEVQANSFEARFIDGRILYRPNHSDLELILVQKK